MKQNLWLDGFEFEFKDIPDHIGTSRWGSWPQPQSQRPSWPGEGPFGDAKRQRTPSSSPWQTLGWYWCQNVSRVVKKQCFRLSSFRFPCIICLTNSRPFRNNCGMSHATSSTGNEWMKESIVVLHILGCIVKRNEYISLLPISNNTIGMCLPYWLAFVFWAFDIVRAFEHTLKLKEITFTAFHHTQTTEMIWKKTRWKLNFLERRLRINLGEKKVENLAIILPLVRTLILTWLECKSRVTSQIVHVSLNCTLLNQMTCLAAIG